MSEDLFNTEGVVLNTPDHLTEDSEQTNTKHTEEDDLMQEELNFEQNDEYLEEAEDEIGEVEGEENNIEEEPENEEEELDNAEEEVDIDEELVDVQHGDETKSKKARIDKLTELPLSKIKFIVKTDPDVHSVSSEALFLITKTTEKFIQSLSREAWTFAQHQKRKTLKKTDIDQALQMLPIEL
ncbi:unnamed protein product [Diamesa serratosioi]